MKQKVLIVVILSFSFLTTSNANNELSSLIKKVDSLFRSSTSHSEMEMTIKTPHYKRTLSMEVWTRGMDYTFALIKSPRKDKGIATLKRKNEMWNYFPKINKVMKVPPSMMLSSWMGSDFSNDDLVKENTLVDEYDGSITSRSEEQIVATLVPKASSKTLWGKIVIYVKPTSLLPIKQEFYDEKMIKIRTMSFYDVKKMGGKSIPSKMVLVPHHKEGRSTTLIYKTMEFELPLDKSVFTRKNLQKRR